MVSLPSELIYEYERLSFSKQVMSLLTRAGYCGV